MGEAIEGAGDRLHHPTGRAAEIDPQHGRAKDGGGKRSKLSVIVDRFVFLSGMKESDDDSAPQSRKPSQRPQLADSPFDGQEHFSPEDIPFRHSGSGRMSPPI